MLSSSYFIFEAPAFGGGFIFKSIILKEIEAFFKTDFEKVSHLNPFFKKSLKAIFLVIFYLSNSYL